MIPSVVITNDVVIISGEKSRTRHYFCHILFTLKLLDFWLISDLTHINVI